MESVPVLLLESVAVIVTVFDPNESPIEVVVHDEVPLALPLVGEQVGQAHVTELTNTLSVAVPSRFIEALEVL